VLVECSFGVLWGAPLWWEWGDLRLWETMRGEGFRGNDEG
jgi:hypothetical protein